MAGAQTHLHGALVAAQSALHRMSRLAASCFILLGIAQQQRDHQCAHLALSDFGKGPFGCCPIACCVRDPWIGQGKPLAISVRLD